MPTIHLKGRKAGYFFASRLVEEHGEDALKHCAEGSPIWQQVKVLLDEKKESENA